MADYSFTKLMIFGLRKLLIENTVFLSAKPATAKTIFALKAVGTVITKSAFIQFKR